MRVGGGAVVLVVAAHDPHYEAIWKTAVTEHFVVQGHDHAVLAVFADELMADRYASARHGRTVTRVPFVRGHIATTTVHTRWVEVEADGLITADHRDSYEWCPELDRNEETPPAAEIEHYSDGARLRLLGLGTDPVLIEIQLKASMQTAVLRHAPRGRVMP